MWFLMLLLIVGACAVGYVFRVQILAKVLGQPEARINRSLNKKKH